jgi:hypothetical protein
LLYSNFGDISSLLFITGGFGLYRAWVLPEALLKGGFCVA